MKNFDDFYEYFPASYGAIVEHVRQSVENQIGDEKMTSLSPKDYALLQLMIGKISIETTLEVLRAYHKWVSEE